MSIFTTAYVVLIAQCVLGTLLNTVGFNFTYFNGIFLNESWISGDLANIGL